MKVLSKNIFFVSFLWSVTHSVSITLKEFLFHDFEVPQKLSKSIALAKKERSHIEALIDEVGGLALVLPTNAAWEEMPTVFDALYDGNRKMA